MTNVHIHVPEVPFWDRDIYGSAMHNGVPVFSKLGRGPRGFKGDKGDKGDTGNNGVDGWSPWVEFEYPSDPNYPYEPGDPMYGHTVMVVHDRDGEHRVPIDPKVDPDEMTDTDLAKLAGLLTNKKLWPRWVEWGRYPTIGQQPPTMENIKAYTKVTINGAYGFYNEVKLSDGAWRAFSFPLFPKDPESATPTSPTISAKDFVIDDAQFSRNGLAYQFVKGPGEEVETWDTSMNGYPHFLLSSNKNYLYIYPQLETGHPLEEVTLRLHLYPIYPEDVELYLPYDEEEEGN